MIRKITTEVYMTPEEITAERKQLGMTVEQYAKHCGVSVHTVISWVIGRRHRLISKSVEERR